ncbi:MAG: hypothetical protein ACRYGK_06155 [Janthinobacterium lividum]
MPQTPTLRHKGSKEFLQSYKFSEEHFIQRFDFSCWAAGLSCLLNDAITQADIAGYYPKESRQEGVTPKQLQDLIEFLNKRLERSGSTQTLKMTGDYPEPSQLVNSGIFPFMAWCRNSHGNDSHVYIAQKFDDGNQSFTLWDPYTNNHYECKKDLFLPMFAVLLV